MRKITCAIVDDEPLAIKLIENYIGKTPFLEHSGSFTDSITASVELADTKPDLLFLDIQMPDMDGMELARMIPTATKIIFTTAFREYALDSYDLAAIDYLMKPIRYDKFMRAVQKAKEWFKLQDNNHKISKPATDTCAEEIFMRKEGGFQRIALDKILFVEGMKDYVKIYIEGEKFPVITHLTMKSVEETLPPDRFMRVSRSYIVGLKHIRSVDRNMCIYIGDTMVKVTEMYKPALEAFITGNILGK